MTAPAVAVVLAVWVGFCGKALEAQNPFGASGPPPDSSSTTATPKRARVPSLADTSPGKWIYRNHTDDFANKSDQRLTLRAEQATTTQAGDSIYAELWISCGDQFRGNGHRSMMVVAGIPVSYRHDQLYDLTQIQYRFDSDSKPRSHFEQFSDVEHRIFYLGDFFGYYFSKGMFQDMLNAKELRLRYSPLLGDVTETLTFEVAGLRAAIRKLDKCDWPDTP